MTVFVTDRAPDRRAVFDTIALDGTKREKLPNGFLRIRDCRLAKADNVQTYYAAELGLTDRPATAVVRVYRPREEVFAPDSMATFASAPVTDDHPSGGVTADNARQVARGWSGESVREDGDHMVADLLFTDTELIAKVEGGKVELSNGYGMQLEWKAGASPQGETYDAIMRSISGNHIAVVDAGRCGGSCRVSDKAPTNQVADCCPSCQAASETKEGRVADTKTMMVDGIPVEVTPAAEAAINKLTGLLAQAGDKLTAADAKATTDAAAHATALADLQAKLTAAEAKVPTADQLSALVAARAKLMGDAARLAPAIAATLADKSDDDVRKLAVTAKLGDAAVAGKEQAWLNVAFDMAVANLPADGQKQSQQGQGGGAQDALAAALQGGGAAPTHAADAATLAWAENNKYLEDAWRGDQQQGKAH